MSDNNDGIEAFTNETLLNYLFDQHKSLLNEIGFDMNDQSLISVNEVGDGNINYVFIINMKNQKNELVSLCIKQALPYIRIVKEASLDVKRLYFEHLSLTYGNKYCNRYVPKLYGYDEKKSCILMECLDHHIILRKGLMNEIEYPSLANDMSKFLAHSLFFTSDFYLSAKEKRQMVSEFSNNYQMCGLTEQVIFTCPYIDNPSFPNHWTEPYLDSVAESLKLDKYLKQRVCQLKQKFLCNTEALLHGDLHTGSIMVTSSSTKVIDPEFAFFGPLGFDIGLFIGNILTMLFSKCRKESLTFSNYQLYLLKLIEDVWNNFVHEFTELWNNNEKHLGDIYPISMINSNDIQAKTNFFQNLWIESCGFAGCEMIRRIVGIAHLAEFDTIENTAERSYCEFATILCARWMICHSSQPSVLFDTVRTIATTNHSYFYKVQRSLISHPRILILVAKYPQIGSAKTRLAKDIGNKAACDFIWAMLEDLLTMYNNIQNCQRYLLFTPKSKQDLFQKFLSERKLDWTLLPMISGEDERDSNLTNKLSAALTSVRKYGTELVTFIGYDAIVPIATIEESFEVSRNGKALICPAYDGGYVLLGLPPNSDKDLQDDLIFQGVYWSSHLTCVSQIQALQRQKIDFIVGDEFQNDIDTLNDLKKCQENSHLGEKTREFFKVNDFKFE